MEHLRKNAENLQEEVKDHLKKTLADMNEKIKVKAAVL